jgi:hypothetical protein
MPYWNTAYIAPYRLGSSAECTCGLSARAPEDRDRAGHSSLCEVGKIVLENAAASMALGTSLPSAVAMEERVGVEDSTELLDHTVLALVEEQRTANLIAIADSAMFPHRARARARDEVIRRMRLNELG